MIIKVNGILLCSTSKEWENKEKNTSGISYNSLFYADKSVTTCKNDDKLNAIYKDKELVKGLATIEIKETNFNEKERVVYSLLKFEEVK
jgi:hypothetical protein